MLDLVIKGGQVVMPHGVAALDVGVQGEKIVALGWPGTLAADAGRIVDAHGKIAHTPIAESWWLSLHFATALASNPWRKCLHGRSTAERPG